jgi:hypothetical protein
MNSRLRQGGRAARALPWLLLIYACASLWHFAHNAEYLTDYPNLPHNWSREEVYVAWLAVSLVGLVGWLGYRTCARRTGLALLALYACAGFAGLLHYTRAPLHRHSLTMNLTILTEALTALVLCIDLLALARREVRS